MASQFYMDAYVLCPFYTKENPIDIKCQGLCGSHSIQEFKSGKAKNEYKDDFCMSLYWNCPQYRALMEDYDEKERTP